MYSICSLEQNDVLNSIIAMKQRGYRGPVIQTTKDEYERLRYQKEGVREYADSLLKNSTHFIDLTSNTLHVLACEDTHFSKRLEQSGEQITCHILDLQSTGLSLCHCCQSKSKR